MFGLGAAACDGGSGGPPPTPVEGHPRLFVTSEDVEKLRGWAVASNPFYERGLKNAATMFRDMMDSGGLVLDENCTNQDGFIPCEWPMEIFAFMSLVAPDETERTDYGNRAKTILMSMINQAAQGPLEGSYGVRATNFAVGDRSRGAGRAFGLTVDWIYPYLSAADKQTIRTVFLRWADENVNATVTTHNHPEPIGVFNDEVLLQNKDAVRFATNNYFTGHGRNLGLMAMSFDPADDPDGKLKAYLDNSTGAFLYMTDAALRDDCAGGLMAEGFEYGPLTAQYTADLLFALHTAGLDDPAIRGPQVRVTENPFWADMIPAYVHGMAPSLHKLDYPGPYHDYASFGDQETYEPYTGVQNDPILYFSPLAILALDRGDQQMYDTIRWIELNMPPGGDDPEQLAQRSGGIYAPQNAISYFMLMDPNAGATIDPRPSYPLDYYASGLRYLFSRTGWEQDDSYFVFQVTWTGIDHRHGDANNFGLHRKGEWITKEHTGYGAYESAVHNNVSIENDKPSHDDSISNKVWQTGSQVTYYAAGDGEVLAKSFKDTFVYALGDATKLYNSPESNGTTDIVHASRSIVWLKPDHVVIYDRAETKTDGRFKRFHLQTPSAPNVSGDFVSATTKEGQQMFFTALLPQSPNIGVDTPEIEYEAGGDPMEQRLTIESTDLSARFLNVVQGADAGASADEAEYVKGAGSTPFDGAVVKGTFVAFPVDLDATFADCEFDVPDTTTVFLVTGLTPSAGYAVTVDPPSGGTIHVKVTAGGGTAADDGGVLAF